MQSLDCPHRPPCDGCPRLPEPGLTPRVLARLAEVVSSFGGALGPAESNAELAYRVRSRLAVRGTFEQPKIGLFQAHSHHIVDIPNCLIHHPLINDCASLVKRTLRDVGVEPYRDPRHTGLVRYLQLVVERSSASVQLVVVCNATSSAEAKPLLDEVAARLGPRLHSLWFNGNTSAHNTILGPTWEHLCGPRAVEEHIGGARVFFPPDAFGQANLGLFESIVARIQCAVPDDSRVVEYHAGVGAIGLGLLDRSQSVDFVELAQGGLEGLRMGLAALDSRLASKARIHPGLASAHSELLSSADTVIVDPPRKGLEPRLLEALCACPPNQLIYLSCGLDSFARDARVLKASGRFRLQTLVPYVLLPFTEHVETLALFERC